MADNLNKESVNEEVNNDVAEELEELTEESENIENDDESSIDYVEIDGEKVTFDDLREWKKGQLRQADYTKKTMALAEERKALPKKIAEEKFSELTDSIQSLQSLIKETDEGIDWNELRENDIVEYTKQKELREKRISKINEAKQKAQIILNEQRQARLDDETQKLFDSIPEWVDSKGNIKSDVVKADFELIGKYAKKIGFTDEDIQHLDDHRVYKSLLAAAKYDQAQEKVNKKEPVNRVIKSKTKQSNSLQEKTLSRAELFYGTT